MAKVRVENSEGAPHFVVGWDVAPVVEAVSRLSTTTGSRPAGLKITGRRPGEMLSAIKNALSEYDPVQIDNLTDLRSFVGKNATHVPALADKLSAVFDRLPDWSLDRYRVYSRNGELWSFTSKDLAGKIFSNSPSPLRSPEFIDKIVAAICDAFENRVVIFSKPAAVDTRYANVLLPLITRLSHNSTWIFLDGGNSFPEIQLPSISRDYISEDEMISALSGALNTTYSTAKTFANKHRMSDRSYEYTSDRFTEFDFHRNIDHYIAAAARNGIEEIPEVPPARGAPLQFLVKDQQLSVSQEVSTFHISKETVRATLLEISDLVSDVFDHHNLSNVSPVLSSKIRRLSGKSDAMISGNLTVPDIITFGVLVDSIEESLAAERNELMPGAEGAIRGLIVQCQIFVNRFDERRSYLRDAYLVDEQVSIDTAVAAAQVLEEALKTPQAIHRESMNEIAAAIQEVAEGTLPAERKGIVASVQNMVAIAAAYAKELIVQSGRLLAGSATKAATTVGGGAIIAVLIHAEPQLLLLAHSHPTLFAWTVDFLKWIRSSVEVLKTR